MRLGAAARVEGSGLRILRAALRRDVLRTVNPLDRNHGAVDFKDADKTLGFLNPFKAFSPLLTRGCQGRNRQVWQLQMAL